MKKTLSVNLGGIVYHIDEDAYSVLMDYLQGVKKHLGNEASSEEVLNDIEQRISELFGQWMQGRREVITTADVDRVIGILGRPEQYESASTDETSSNEGAKESADVKQEQKIAGPHRRLYRDSEGGVLGGVCSGLAIYLNVSVVLIRLLFFLMAWLGCSGVFVYIVCWIIVPEARTAAQRLEMRGEDVTIENIEKKVREEYGKVKDRVDGYVSSNRFQQNTRSLGNGFLEVVRVCIKVFFGFIAGAIGLAFFAALIGLLFALVVLMTGNFSFMVPMHGDLQPFQDILMNPTSAIWMIVGLVLVLGIPFIAIFKMLFGRILNLRPSARWAIWVGFILWFIGLGLCVYSSVLCANQCGSGLWI